MFTVEKVHPYYYVVRDGSFDILYVNIDAHNGTVTVTTEEQGVTLQQLLLALAAFTEHMRVKK